VSIVVAEAHSNRKSPQPYLSEGAVHCRHPRILFGKAVGKELLVLCRAADPESGVRLPVSFACQKLLEAGTCRKQLGKGYVFDYFMAQLS